MAEIQITTTQNVGVVFKSAEPEKRIFSFLIDIFLIFLYLLIVNYFYGITLKDYVARNYSDFWSQNAVSIIISSPAFFYTLILEFLFEGQTIGKKILNIKVVKIDGFRANFLDFFIRWSMRLIDILGIPMVPGIMGFLVIFNTQKHQRIGGIVSGTAVIDLKINSSINQTIFEELEVDYKPTFTSVLKLTDLDIRVIKEAYDGALKNNNHSLLIKIQKKITAVTSIEPKRQQTASEFVDCIIKDYNYLTNK